MQAKILTNMLYKNSGTYAVADQWYSQMNVGFGKVLPCCPDKVVNELIVTFASGSALTKT